MASAGTRIVLSGRFPGARYASVQVYTPAGVGASLPDYRIAPQPGSLNPWRQQAAPGGRFTVTIRPDPAPGQANTLPMPAGTTSQHPGYLVYRVYLPAGGASAVPLPVLMSDAQAEGLIPPGARAGLIRAGLLPASPMAGDLRRALARLTADFRDKAPLSATDATAVILDGVRSGVWRILVGQDARRIDAAVRARPEAAYDYAELFSTARHPPARDPGADS